MTNAITTTVTWQDLRDAQQRELDDLEAAYEELEELADDDALNRPVPSDLSEIEDDDLLQRAAIQQQAELLEQSRATIEKRINLLSELEDRLGAGPWEIKMLSGQEVMATEADLRTDAQANDWGRQTTQMRRNYYTVDAAVVDGPEDIPRSDDGTLNVSEHVPNALVNSLYEQVERFNSAGDPDFRPEGFGSSGGLGPSVSSGTPSQSNTVSVPSDSTDETPPESGSDS